MDDRSLLSYYQGLLTSAHAQGRRLLLFYPNDFDGYYALESVKVSWLGGVELNYRRGRGPRYATTVTHRPFLTRRNGEDVYVVLDFDDERVMLVNERSIAGAAHVASAVGSDSLVGARFGLLTVTAVFPGVSGSPCIAQCRCDCGGTRRARVSSLRSGGVISCGCRRGKAKSCGCLRGQPA